MIVHPDRPQRPNFRRAADIVTRTRKYIDYGIAARIAMKGPEFRSWSLAGAHLGSMVLDVADGWLARRSNIANPASAREDEENDKKGHRAKLSAMAVATGNPIYLVYSGLTDLRNGLTSRSRDQLDETRRRLEEVYGPEKVLSLETDARDLGKLKTLTQNLAVLVDVSPIGNVAPKPIHAMHLGALGLVGVSGYDIVHNANQQIARAEAELIPETLAA